MECGVRRRQHPVHTDGKATRKVWRLAADQRATRISTSATSSGPRAAAVHRPRLAHIVPHGQPAAGSDAVRTLTDGSRPDLLSRSYRCILFRGYCKVVITPGSPTLNAPSASALHACGPRVIRFGQISLLPSRVYENGMAIRRAQSHYADSMILLLYSLRDPACSEIGTPTAEMPEMPRR